MSYKILPGHLEDNSNKGWQPTTTLEEIIKHISQGKAELNWYKTLDDNDPDTVKAHYSIPSPFPTAYLFKEVMNDSNHELSLEVVELILCMLYDIYKGNAKLEFIPKPEKDKPFFSFWKIAPKFIIYDDKLPVFVKDGEIIGGLSTYSLVWAAPNYKPMYIIQDNFPKTIKSANNGFRIINQNDKKALYAFLKFIQEKKSPHNNFNKFWANSCLNNILQGIQPLNKDLYNVVQNDFAPWLVEKNEFLETGLISLEYFEKNKDIAHSKNFEILGICNYKNSTGEEKYSKLLYPILPSCLKSFFSNKKNGKESLNVTPSGDKGYAELNINGTKHTLNSTGATINKCSRSLAIWPPFKSAFCETYVMERIPFASGKGTQSEKIVEQLPLEFYDEDGTKLNAKIISEEELNLNVQRLYKLEKQCKFPQYIRIHDKDYSEKHQTSGFIKINSRKKKHDTTDKLKIAIDFGSSHTTVAYKDEKSNEAKNILFDNCRPLFIGDEDEMRHILVKFVPDMLIDKIPFDENEFDQNTRNWLPFRTLFNQFNEQKYSFLEAGVIPLYGNIKQIGEFVKQGVYKKDIKWTAKTQLRDGFLNYLTTLSLVEAEGMGYKPDNMKIFWAYPKAFSTDEEMIITNYWLKKNKEYKDILNLQNDIIIPKGITESVAVMQYFNHYGKLIPSKEKLALTIDIGGGSSDFSFFGVNDKHQADLAIQDSIKFAGGDLANCVKGIVINRLNQLLENDNFEVDQDYDELMRSWPCVKYDWDNHIGNFKTNNPDYPIFEEIITLFYGSLCYFAGMHLRANGNEGLKLNQIAFGGNGSQFFRYFTMGSDPNEHLKLGYLSRFTELFRKLTAAGQGIAESDYQKLEFMFTSHPKKEVTYGLLESDPDKNYNKDCNQKLFGISVTLDNETIPWDKWPNKQQNGDKLTATVLSFADEYDFSEFKNFLVKFYELFNSIDGFKDYDINRKFDNFEEFENLFKHKVGQRDGEPIVTPLFFTALSVWFENITETI